jgi:hypothetical protein
MRGFFISARLQAQILLERRIQEVVDQIIIQRLFLLVRAMVAGVPVIVGDRYVSRLLAIEAEDGSGHNYNLTVVDRSVFFIDLQRVRVMVPSIVDAISSQQQTM